MWIFGLNNAKENVDNKQADQENSAAAPMIR